MVDAVAAHDPRQVQVAGEHGDDRIGVGVEQFQQ
jgi:hypothetical protein